MSSLAGPHNPNRYWRSLAELADTAEFRRFVEAEFPGAAPPEGMSRRRWLRLMGASLALAGITGCRWKKAEILPMAERSAERTPGRPQRFATAMELGGAAMGLLVTCVDGRPVKIEGNPKHPASLGATDALAQAAILEIYDPDRSRNVVERAGGRETVRSWEEFSQFARSHFDGLRETGGAGFRVLSEASSSPTLAAMRNRLLETFPEARWHEYEPISRHNEQQGAKLAFGKPVRTHLHLDKARVILCLDADLFGAHPDRLRYARQFAQGRVPVDGEMSRLYVLESGLSITGAAADERLALRCQEIADCVTTFTGLRNDVFVAKMADDEGVSEAEGVDRFVQWFEELKSREPSNPVLSFLSAVVEDLAANPGRCVVVAGPRMPTAVHQCVHDINRSLGNVGTTVTYTNEDDPDRPSHEEAIRSLVDEIAADEVQTLLILGGNPVYNAPADLEFAKALGDVETSIHLALHRNETSRACSWHVPQAHFLESWGDARAFDGTYGVVQPMIEPLYGGKSAIVLLAIVLGDQPPSAYDLVRTTFEQIAGEDDLNGRWRRTVHDGLLDDSHWPVLPPDFALPFRLESLQSARPMGPVAARLPNPDRPRDDLEIVFTPDATLYDGRFANNGWLQEMPDPVTRLTWGNAAVMSLATAERLGVEDGSLVKLTFDGRSAEMPVCIVPGQADGSVAVSLGYGRTAAGHVGGLVDEGVEPVGVDVYRLRTTGAMHFGTGLSVEPTGRKVRLATVQDHFAIDTVGMQARARRVGTLVREATLEHYREHPDFAKHAVHHPPLESLWKEHEYRGHRWGMAIDLAKCIGCGACVVACQAENNVPIVGRERVLQGREMHWIRVDRYFRGDPHQPQVAMQPVACHHCELAPCEQVCPVAATVHDAEGLNVMVYNRCVGTRYCANNCPYKVRRFNYFNYHKDLGDPANEVAKMAHNPEVTVRSRGVMEKCTYCVQRIKAATIDAKNSGRRVQDGEIRTACQQACPTGAIAFGDLADPESRVAELSADGRSYAMLGELNVKPRTVYLARIRNPNPKSEEIAHHGDTEEHGETEER